MLTIIDCGLGYHSYPLLRGQMEGLADLVNLREDPDYLKHMEFQNQDSIQKHRIAAKSGNPYLSLIAQRPSLDADLSEHGKELKALREKGARKLELKEKMTMARLKDEYEALVVILNDHAHGGIRALRSRHLRDDGNDYQLVAFRHGDAEVFGAVIQTSTDVVLRASVAFHDAFDTQQSEFFNELIALEGSKIGK
jgi:hypothetical protein